MSTSASTDLSVLPESNDQYGTQEYWEKRYRSEPDKSFDWFLNPDQCLPYIEDLVPSKASRILMLGCGNSLLSEAMYDLGYTNIINIDYSAALIENMREKHQDLRPEMRWLEMDIRDLKFEADSFDVAIDKGTMDALLTGVSDVWNPEEEVVNNCNQEISETLRVLKKSTGVFVYLTFGQPHFRKRYMINREGWDLDTKEIEGAGTFSYFRYVLSPSKAKQP